MKKKIYQRAISLVLVFMLCVTYLSVQEVQAAEITELTSDTTYTDMLEDASTEKCYSYTMDKTGYFKVKFAVADSNQSAEEWKVELVDVITRTTFYTVVLKESATLPAFNFPKGRQISIKVTNAGENVPVGQQYTITVKSVASTSWEQEKLISSSKSWSARTSGATVAGLGKKYYGNLCIDQDDDLYKLIVSKNGYVTVKFNPGSDDVGCGYTVKLLSSKGKEIAKYNAKTSVSKKYYLAKGTYYVDVQQRAGYSNPPLNKTYTLSTSYTASTPKKVTSLTKSNVTVSWKKVPDVAGYQVSYSTSSRFKNAKTRTTTKTSYMPTDLTPNKTYYVRVRTYRKAASGAKVYGAWSKSTTLKLTSAPNMKFPYKLMKVYGNEKEGYYVYWTYNNGNERDSAYPDVEGNALIQAWNLMGYSDYYSIYDENGYPVHEIKEGYTTIGTYKEGKVYKYSVTWKSYILKRRKADLRICFFYVINLETNILLMG